MSQEAVLQVLKDAYPSWLTRKEIEERLKEPQTQGSVTMNLTKLLKWHDVERQIRPINCFNKNGGNRRQSRYRYKS